MGGLYFLKNDGKIEFKVENNNIKKVLRNYENNIPTSNVREALIRS